ncbi:hypothetical protein F3J23_06485 [Chryseobacterium sp. Tr-659]|uniref:hypothetical protein n=1 Tax=Chryseobacterium sp. Tr-659 TaxID=2608340 RepID=UPI001423C621|nr:hypothetical protein [Chryseobacterium sp. Tr-659]NIF05086.1 hypothetical protein [Chryseobacterium sp. Tr-659]
MNITLQEKVDQLEKKYIRLKFTFILSLFMLMIVSIFLSFQKTEIGKGGVLEAKGLIIKDEQGHPRIVIGAPLKKIKDRTRPDELYGIVYLDENGRDRITIGKDPDPMTPKGIFPRRTGGAGILLHDKDGIERSGYSILDDDMAVLTLDWPKTGEAIALSSGNNFSGIGVFHKSDIGKYREAVTIGVLAEKKQSFLKICDSMTNIRAMITQENMKNPELKHYDKNGKETFNKSWPQ